MCRPKPGPVFANVAAREQHGGAAAVIDRYFALWSEPDGGVRGEGLAAVASEDVEFRDPYGCTRGRDDLGDHIGASQMHMPGVRLERASDVRQCQGTAVADWTAVKSDGSAAGRGTNVFDLAPDGRISRIVGLWSV